jgi:hypothetical protein
MRGDVTAGDEHGADQVGWQCSKAALDGSAGALHLVLVGDDERRVDAGAVLHDEVALVTHDHLDVLSSRRTCGADGVAEERQPTDGVQDLGGRGLHPGAFTCGEDDDGSRSDGVQRGGSCGVGRRRTRSL